MEAQRPIPRGARDWAGSPQCEMDHTLGGRNGFIVKLSKRIGRSARFEQDRLTDLPPGTRRGTAMLIRAQNKRHGLFAGIAFLSVMLSALIHGSVHSQDTLPSSPTRTGILVLEVTPPDAILTLDGEKIGPVGNFRKRSPPVRMRSRFQPTATSRRNRRSPSSPGKPSAWGCG
jgi:hypothetical protein